MTEKKANHIGIIMDGNRRFAKSKSLVPWKGHEEGAKKLGELIEWAKEFDIKQLTLYTFSLENFNRPKEEFDNLMRIFTENFDKLKDDKRIYDNKIRVRVLGRIEMFPKEVQEKINYIVEKTKDHDQYTINFAMAYGGRGEIVDAAKKIAKDAKEGNLNPEDINENTFKNYLYMTDEPDLVIRTGGDRRTSNYFPYQCTYSEWFFLPMTWPEFSKDALIEVLDEFENRERRFGK